VGKRRGAVVSTCMLRADGPGARVRTLLRPSSIASRTVSSGKKSQKPSTISTASEVPAITRLSFEIAISSRVGLITNRYDAWAPS